MKNLTSNELIDKLDNDQNAFLLDVRSEEEYEEMDDDDGNPKVKVIKLHGGDVGSVMDELLGHSSSRMMGR